MTKRHPRRTDEEWMNLIQECRTSGLTDKEWCREHQIHSSNFYYHIRRLREMACEIPEPASGSTRTGFQEVVPITFEESFTNPSEYSCAAGSSAIIRFVSLFYISSLLHTLL